MSVRIFGWRDYVPELLRAIHPLKQALEYRGLSLEVLMMDPRRKELVFLIQLSPDRAMRLAVKISERRWWLNPSMGERYFERLIKHISKNVARREGSLSIDNEALVLTGRFARRSKPERRYRFMPNGGVGRKGHRTRIYARSPSGATYSTTIFSYHKPPRALVKLVLGLLRRITGARYERIMASCRDKGVKPFGGLADLCEVLGELRDLIGLSLNVDG